MKKRLLAAALVGVIAVLSGCSSAERGVATAPAASTAVNATGGSSSAGTSSGAQNPDSEIASSETSGSETSSAAGGGSDPGAGFDYSSTPATLPPTVGSENQGRIAEGVRLSEYVVVPTFALPDYTELRGFSTYVIKDGESSANILPTGTPEVATKFEMVAGFGTGRGTLNDSVGRSRELISAVLIFGSPEDAASAAAEMNAAIGAVKDGPDTMVIPGVEGDPVATAVSGMNSGQAQVFVARGSLVIYVMTSTKGDAVEAMGQVIATLLKAQFAATDTFVPTPTDQLARLPVDRDGMLAHTLLSPENFVNVNKVFGINGFKHFFANPLDDEPSIRAGGVDLVSKGLTTVYRAKDAAGAQLVADEYWRQYPELMGESQEYASRAGVEGTRCQQSSDGVLCVFTNGRYVVEASSDGDNPEPDVDAMVSAQNALLTGF